MQDDLPVKKDGFLAEAEVMDLSPLREKTYVVGVACGDPDGVKYICSSIHGPYSYIEMVQEVGEMWVNHQHHAKVIVLDRDQNYRTKMLDKNTVDYIECHYTDIITEEMLGGAFDKKYTCKAGLVFEEESTDPRHQKKAESDATECVTLPR